MINIKLIKTRRPYCLTTYAVRIASKNFKFRPISNMHYHIVQQKSYKIMNTSSIREARKKLCQKRPALRVPLRVYNRLRARKVSIISIILKILQDG